MGEEALTFARAVGEHGKVICIEAHPETFRCLEKLVQYNRLGNVIAIQQAVSEPSCEVTTIGDGKHYLPQPLGRRWDPSCGDHARWDSSEAGPGQDSFPEDEY